MMLNSHSQFNTDSAAKGNHATYVITLRKKIDAQILPCYSECTKSSLSFKKQLDIVHVSKR